MSNCYFYGTIQAMFCLYAQIFEAMCTLYYQISYIKHKILKQLTELKEAAFYITPQENFKIR